MRKVNASSEGNLTPKLQYPIIMPAVTSLHTILMYSIFVIDAKYKVVKLSKCNFKHVSWEEVTLSVVNK